MKEVQHVGAGIVENSAGIVMAEPVSGHCMAFGFRTGSLSGMQCVNPA